MFQELSCLIPGLFVVAVASLTEFSVVALGLLLPLFVTVVQETGPDDVTSVTELFALASPAELSTVASGTELFLVASLTSVAVCCCFNN